MTDSNPTHAARPALADQYPPERNRGNRSSRSRTADANPAHADPADSADARPADAGPADAGPADLAGETDFHHAHRRRKRHSRSWQARHKRGKMIRHMLVGVLPYLIFLLGLTIAAISLAQYIEQSSPLSLFLINRDTEANWTGSDPASNWDEEPLATDPDPTPAGPEPSPAQTQANGNSSSGNNGSNATSGSGGQQSVSVSTEPAVPAQIPQEKAELNENGELIVPFYYVGDPFGIIQIPGANLKVRAYQGDEDAQLRKGAGHFTSSFFPGQSGNILMGGHSDTYFNNLQHVETGDKVYFDTTYGRFVYQVREIRIVDDSNTAIAGETANEQLTLYTCYPFDFIGNAPKRFIVICTLVDKRVNL